MTRRLFVCHATADIEATSELVDALENALSFSTGSLWTSGLPGYCADANDMPALGAALAGSDVVLALVTQASVQDAQFHFQLGAAWALGAHTVLFLLEPVADDALPSALDQASVMRGHEPSQWSELIGDLSVRLGLVPRPGASYAPAISPSSPPPAPKSAPPLPAALPSPPRIPAEAAALIAAAEAPAAASSQAHRDVATGPRLHATATSQSTSSAHAHAVDAGSSPTLTGAAAPSAALIGTAATASSTRAGAASASTPSMSSARADGTNAEHSTTATPGESLARADAVNAARSDEGSTASALTEAAAPAYATASPATSANVTEPPALTEAAAPAYASGSPATSTHGTAPPALTDSAAPAHATASPATSAPAALTDAAAPAYATATPATSEHATTTSAQPAASATAQAGAARAKRSDDTPLPAALAKIANASARPPGATTALHAAGAQISAAKAQQQPQPTAATPSKTISVPPLPGAPPSRPTHVPPLPTAGQPRTGVPPLPAAVSTSSLIVPPPPAGAHADFDDSGEPTTTPKAPIIILTSIPETEAEPSPPPRADLKPQPRAAGTYPSVTPQHSYLDELRAIDPAERTPPRYSYVDELETLDPEADAAATSDYEALPSDDDDEPETREQLRVPTREEPPTDPADPASDSDVFARLPTCEMALEAGRAVSDCLFNRNEISDFTADLDGPLGGLIESLGASWTELREEQDLDIWVAVTDHLLQTLPEEVRKLEEWYRVGFELAILHNLAAQLVLDGSDAAAEQHWRGALERFLMRAERAEIGYENLGRVLGLLENLAGPSHERDLTNISRSLEELRRYAAGADIHTAA